MRLHRLAAVCAGLAMVAGISVASAQGPKEIKVPLLTADGKDAGTATFKTGVKLELNLKNLTPGQHGAHIHAIPTCTPPDFKSAGGHFNPDAKQHGYMNAMGHHNGDLPDNINVADDGTGHATFVLTSISLDPAAANSLFLNGGTALVVHAKADDEKTDPSGDSGARVACGVIKQ